MSKCPGFRQGTLEVDNLYRSCPLSQNLRVSKFKSAQPTERTVCSTTQNPCISPGGKEVKQCQTVKSVHTNFGMLSSSRIMGSWDLGCVQLLTVAHMEP